MLAVSTAYTHIYSSFNDLCAHTAVSTAFLVGAIYENFLIRMRKRGKLPPLFLQLNYVTTMNVGERLLYTVQI